MFRSTHGASRPLWLDSARMPSCPTLGEAVQADVCVIGGGLAGLSTAYLLSRAGKDVVLLEAWQLASGESGRTTAHWMPPDDRYCEIERAFGPGAAALVAQSFRQACELAESITRDEGIDCAFRHVDGYLYCLPGQDLTLLDRELDAARRAGVAVERVARVPGLPFDTGAALRFARQAQCHPVRYLAGLAQAAMRRGVRLFCDSRALGVERAGERQRVRTAGGVVEAASVVVATNTPFVDRVVMHTKQSGYRTYVCGFEVPRDALPPLLLWDCGDPYYYVRLDGSEAHAPVDTLIVGGADHKVGQERDPGRCYRQIEQWVRERFPKAGALRHRWSGQVMEPADGLAYFGRNPMDDGQVYIITGDSGTGMTHCTAGAMTVSDLILGRSNEWAALYDPARKATHALGEFVKEQANTLAQYRELLTAGEVDEVGRIPPGQGAVLRSGARKLAVYRDELSQLHVCSALCTHLGCVVAWNAAEKSWDCPCHASRFDIDGQVLHGPASRPLQKEVGPQAG
ncbi:MAG TPA: FAD-dependent oxidoreductase [Burkholderiaceae bacterium]|nr:FAD-dependent oxidoreductase [Burkholderiaceae bacterium]